MVSTRALVALLSGCVAVMAVCAHRAAWWPGFVAGAWGAVLLGAWLWHRDALTTRQVLVGAVLFRLLFLPLLPGLSDDGFRYVWDGLVQLQGVNPYRYAPEASALAALHDTALYEGLNSASFYSVYPPVSQGIFAFGALFYDAGGWPASYFAIKGVLVLMELGGVFLLARMVKARMLMLYAWHPLVLVEVAGQPHTEAALVLFLVATLLAARRGRGGWASAALAAAVWTKLYPVVLFPFLWRRFGWRAVWPGAALSAILVVPYAAPYVLPHLRASLDLYVQFFEFNAGPYLAIKGALDLFTGEDWSKQLGPALRWVFLASLPLWYVWDARQRWPLARAFLVVIGAYLVCSTTVHPWYLLAALPLVAALPTAGWHWQWLAACSLGTYLFYIGGPYAAWVVLGWGGWLAWALWTRRDGLLQRVQRRRAGGKARRVRSLLDATGGVPTAPLRVLDLGAGEGYVGQALAERAGAQVVLADVLPLNRTALPHVRYDGRRLPFADDRFDVAVLYFVLHHSEDPRRVLREALRVTKGRVVIAESVYRSEGQRRLLRALDQTANRLRSGGAMAAQETHLRFRTAAAWRAMAEAEGAAVLAMQEQAHPIHRQAFLVIRKQ